MPDGKTLVVGQAVARAMQPERYIVGCADPTEPLPEAYAAVLAADGCPVLRLRYESAEMAKKPRTSRRGEHTIESSGQGFPAT